MDMLLYSTQLEVISCQMKWFVVLCPVIIIVNSAADTSLTFFMTDIIKRVTGQALHPLHKDIAVKGFLCIITLYLVVVFLSGQFYFFSAAPPL